MLAQLAEVDTPASGQPFAARLSQWLHWTDAVALSGALDATAASTALHDAASPDADRQALAQWRRAQAQAIAKDCAIDAEAADFQPYRRRYQPRQQAMSTGIAPLRARLRARLAEGSSEQARLAALDVVVEQMMGSRERVLLSTLPDFLQRHFERLGATDGGPDDFRQDMQALLLAELDMRLQPLEGLLAAQQHAPSGQP